MLAREGEQILGQAGTSLSGAASVGDMTQRSIGSAAAEPQLREFQIADHRGQQIVEVVRDAAGQLTNRLHFLRLVQRLLGLASLLGLARQLQRAFGDSLFERCEQRGVLPLPVREFRRHVIEGAPEQRDLAAAARLDTHAKTPVPPMICRFRQARDRSRDELPAADPRGGERQQEPHTQQRNADRGCPVQIGEGGVPGKANADIKVRGGRIVYRDVAKDTPRPVHAGYFVAAGPGCVNIPVVSWVEPGAAVLLVVR